MSILRQHRLTEIFVVLLICMTSCAREHSRSIISVHNVQVRDVGFSNQIDAQDVIRYNNITYFITATGVYDQSKNLTLLSVNKPEGPVHYGQDLIEQDSSLCKYYEMSPRLNWRWINDEQIMLGATTLKLLSLSDNLYYVKSKNGEYIIAVK